MECPDCRSLAVNDLDIQTYATLTSLNYHKFGVLAVASDGPNLGTIERWSYFLGLFRLHFFFSFCWLFSVLCNFSLFFSFSLLFVVCCCLRAQLYVYPLNPLNAVVAFL